MRNSFVLYTDYKQHIDLLTTEEKAQLLDAIFGYAEGNEIELDGATKMAFSFIKAQMDRDNDKYQETCDKRRAAGAKGGAPAGNTNAKKQAKQANGCLNKQNNQKQAKQPDTDNDNDTDTDNDTDIVKEKESKKKSADKPHRSFVPPTVEQVREYCQERKRGVDPQAFVDFYASKGWFVGKNKMKDWKAAVRTWEQRSRGQPKSKIEIDSNFRNFLEQNQVIDWETGG